MIDPLTDIDSADTVEALQATITRLRAEAIEDKIVMGRLSSGKELQHLMNLNNGLLARAEAAEARVKELEAATHELNAARIAKEPADD
jgi:hypothetical protein